MRNFILIASVISILSASSLAQNYSLNFDGTQYVTINNSSSLEFKNKFTIEYWFTIQGLHKNDWIGVISKTEPSHALSTGFTFRLYAPLNEPVNMVQWAFLGTNAEFSTKFSPKVDTWYHSAVSCDGDSIRFFLNGDLYCVKKFSGWIINNSEPITIGGQNGNYMNRNLNGRVSNVRISNIARYKKSFKPSLIKISDENTIALWPFYEGEGNILHDISPNKNDGIIIGAKWINEESIDINIQTSKYTQLDNELNSFTDPRDGKKYTTVKIGNQVWLQALKYEAFDSYCFANSENVCNNTQYINGRYYSFEAAQNSVPTGWHIPSYKEWRELIDYFGNDYKAIEELLSTGKSGFQFIFDAYGLNGYGYGGQLVYKQPDVFKDEEEPQYAYFWMSNEGMDYGSSKMQVSAMVFSKKKAPITVAKPLYNVKPIQVDADRPFNFQVRCVKD